MTRQEKYPETKTFHFHNANPRGRITTDCVIRALSTATGLDYRTVVFELAEIQCATGYDDAEKRTIDKFLTSHGLSKEAQPRKDDGTKYTGREFCRYLNRKYPARKPNVVAMIGCGHIVCVKVVEDTYKVWDIWNSTDGCIGNWWVEV